MTETEMWLIGLVVMTLLALVGAVIRYMANFRKENHTAHTGLHKRIDKILERLLDGKHK